MTTLEFWGITEVILSLAAIQVEVTQDVAATILTAFGLLAFFFAADSKSLSAKELHSGV